MVGSIPEFLEKRYVKHGVVLFLGAGISIGSRLPDWDGLLERIYKKITSTLRRRPSFTEMRSSFSSTAFGGLLERICANNGLRFDQIVRECLYAEFPFFNKDVRDPNYSSALIDFVHHGNPTLRAIAALCASKDALSFVGNPRIRAVVNFNLDAVLRSFVRAKYGSIVRTIERPSAGPRLGRINVYYPHGFLDFDQRYFDNLAKESPDRLVLSEGRYFDFFNRPTELFTYTLLFLLREYTCVFVGMSMHDDNLRRLLHYSFQERAASYRVEGHVDLKASTRGVRHYVISCRSRNRCLGVWKKSLLNSLGVEQVLITNYGHIPAVLKRLYEADGRKWIDVW